jgi:sialate O-acetylesterase
MKNLFYSLAVTIFSFLFAETHAEVKPAVVFQSNMVLQRDQPITFWGWADPQEKIEITFNGKSVHFRAGKNGRWLSEFPPLSAGGPYDIIIRGKNEIILHDVLIGDVWICSGQSNMQWSIGQTGYKEPDTTFLQRGNVRLFTVRIDTDYMPREDVQSEGWKKLGSDNISNFSAVAYHFGKYLNTELDVPVGLISVNLGATAIETWMSNEALQQFPQFNSLIAPVVKTGKSFAQLNKDFEKTKSTWYARYYKGIGFDQHWFDPKLDTSDWKPIKASGNTWEQEADLLDYDGAVWFRTTFDLPENYEEKTFTLHLGQIDDYDIAWVNGKKVGETYGRHNHRHYSIPTDELRTKGNVLVVRVYDLGGIGGFTTSPFWGNPILWGNWTYRVGEKLDLPESTLPSLPNVTPFSSPGVLFNANIAPLTSLKIKGAIWYQGESNADRAYEYRELFPALIMDWRKHWKQGQFPFLFVQLANYEAESIEPRGSSWAELREAQAMTLSLPNTGMATAIDLGEANDIHPKNKEDVGKRLGLTALKIAYGKDTLVSGPSFRKMKIESGRIIIEYDHIGAGLATKDKYGYIRGFQMAGEDRKFYWAQAYIEGAKVVVACHQVPNPVAIRYAWDNNPGPLDLYNREGLPALPFRTDNWSGVTSGIVFQDGPRF